MAYGGTSPDDLDSLPHQELFIALRKVTSASSFLHVERCIAHLNLKPPNVLKAASKYMLIDFDAFEWVPEVFCIVLTPVFLDV